MISGSLLFYCIAVAAVYLFLVSLLLEFLGKKFDVFKGFPPELIENTGAFWFLMNFTMEMLLFVVIPSMAYGYFYILLPLSGVRTGIAGALLAFALGAVPALVGLLVRTRLPVLMFSYLLFGILLKLAGAMIIIGYLYQL
ncbi:MAG TPA: hypothetical protein VHP63_02310 [candidate division Zixibacteria bacterium]|nr:hypothetical protein [candidate division Zixibacteria bacterium]